MGECDDVMGGGWASQQQQQQQQPASSLPCRSRLRHRLRRDLDTLQKRFRHRHHAQDVHSQTVARDCKVPEHTHARTHTHSSNNFTTAGAMICTRGEQEESLSEKRVGTQSAVSYCVFANCAMRYYIVSSGDLQTASTGLPTLFLSFFLPFFLPFFLSFICSG